MEREEEICGLAEEDVGVSQEKVKGKMVDVGESRSNHVRIH
jgi:hypothetical protein